MMPAINKAFREFRRYTSDGLPSAPVSAPLPVGDPSSGIYNPAKSEIRDAFEDVQTAINAGLDDLVGSFETYRYIATSSQTVFTGADANSNTLSYVEGKVIVTVNGVTLSPNSYTASNGTSITLGTPLSASDVVVIYSFGSFAVADTWTRAEADGRYAKRSYFWAPDYDILPGNANNQAGFAALAAAVQANGGGVVEFPANQTYNVYPAGTGGSGTLILMQFSNCRGIKINMNGSKIRSTKDYITDLAQLRVFQFTGCTDITVNATIEQTVAQNDEFTWGVIGIMLQNSNRDGDFKLDITNGRSGIEIVRGAGFVFASQAQDIYTDVRAVGTFYPVAISRNGNSIHGKIDAVNAGRSFFVSNGRDIKFDIRSNNSNGYADVLIGAMAAVGEGVFNNSLENVRINYTREAGTPAVTGLFAIVELVIQQWDLASEAVPVRISDVDVKISADFAGETVFPSNIFTAICQKSGGAAATSNTSGHFIRNVTVSGTVSNYTTGNLIDWMTTGSAGLVGGASNVASIKFSNVTSINGAGAINIAADTIADGLIFENIRAGSSVVTLTNLPAGILTATTNVRASNFRSNDVGYRRLPNGYVEMWGTASCARSANTVVTLPISIRTAPAGGWSVSLSPTTSGSIAMGLNHSLSTTQLTINRPGDGPATAVDVNWRVMAQF
jgi:hypothetical protein